MDAKGEAIRLLDQLYAKMRTFPPANGTATHKPHSTDVIIATFPKAGTTLLQNMCYQIAVATGGAPPFDPDGTNFEDIERVAPWIEYGPVVGITECPSNPRVFKTHRTIDEFDVSKSKFICCLRNPLQFPASWLDFIFDWISDEKATDPRIKYEIVQELSRHKLLGLRDNEASASWKYGNWFSFNRGWTRQPQENVLVLFYEDIVADLTATAQQIAAFMGCTLSDEGLLTVVSRCDRAVMAGDEKFRCILWGHRMGLERRGGMKALPVDRIGYKGIPIEASILDKIEQMMLKTFGVRTYEEACDVLRREQGSLSKPPTLRSQD